ncbi:uncharacterized protein [Drosophila takahashii]|uniref:uncharacterized protein n=1 Tax=Drosophila takahashii TaxID=29030 RepID=UPI001CF8B2B5|nr:uncharacterized protein LOC108058932 [Drosophila takahashii]
MSEEEAPGAGGEESPGDGAVPVEVAPPPPDTTTAAPPDTTTSGARMMMHHPWLAAAAVAVYATKVMWVKFRELGLAKQKKRLKNREKKSKPLQDNEENGSESEVESDAKEDENGPDVQNFGEMDSQSGFATNLVKFGDPDENYRSIEVPPADF